VRLRLAWRNFSTAQKNDLLTRLADAIEGGAERILSANQEDMELTAGNPDMDEAMRDRLLLTRERIAEMAAGVREVALLPNPVGEVLAEWSGQRAAHSQGASPFGSDWIIYEARPNVTVDTVALSLKTGNTVVLRGSKEAANSNQCLVDIMCGVAGMPDGTISSARLKQSRLGARTDRGARTGGRDYPARWHWVDHFRGGEFGGAGDRDRGGNCHIYVDESADLDMADEIVINAKTQRPSVCNAAEKLLVHERIAAGYVPPDRNETTGAQRGVRGMKRLAPGPAGRDASCY